MSDPSRLPARKRTKQPQAVEGRPARSGRASLTGSGATSSRTPGDTLPCHPPQHISPHGVWSVRSGLTGGISTSRLSCRGCYDLATRVSSGPGSRVTLNARLRIEPASCAPGGWQRPRRIPRRVCGGALTAREEATRVLSPGRSGTDPRTMKSGTSNMTVPTRGSRQRRVVARGVPKLELACRRSAGI